MKGTVKMSQKRAMDGTEWAVGPEPTEVAHGAQGTHPRWPHTKSPRFGPSVKNNDCRVPPRQKLAFLFKNQAKLHITRIS